MVLLRKVLLLLRLLFLLAGSWKATTRDVV